MHVMAFPPHAFGSMVERLGAIVEQVYNGHVEMLRAAVNKDHRQSLAESRTNRGAYFTEDSSFSCRDTR